MEFNSNKEQGTVTIEVSGRMDANTAPEFEQECAKWLEQGETTLIVDLQNLEYISSAGLRSVLASGKKLKAQNGSLILCNLSGMVEEVFNISGFSSIFPIYDSKETALKNV
jgi:anti-anti-sigma factor